MEAKRVGNLSVNDGHGLMDNEGLCESLLNDMNNLFKQLFSGQYLLACSVATQITQKLINLKKGIRNDTESLKDNIENLKNQINELNMMFSVNANKKDGVNVE